MVLEPDFIRRQRLYFIVPLENVSFIYMYMFDLTIVDGQQNIDLCPELNLKL